LEYSLEPLDFWQNVVCTVEKICQSCYNGRIRVYRPPNARFEELYTQKVELNGRFSVNHIMENIMLPSVNVVFPQNNFIHTPRIISYWMELQGIRVLPWPTRSPDLNPIAIVWGLVVFT
jgi:hypothetical protein